MMDARTVWLRGGPDNLDGTTTEIIGAGDSIEIDSGGRRWTYLRSTMRVDGLEVWWHTTTTPIHPAFMRDGDQ